MAKLHLHPIGVILILLGIAGWVVALGGLAASTKFCNDRKSEGNALACSQVYQQDWWALFFEFFLLLTMLGTCFINIFPKARYVYLTYLAMVTAMLTMSTKTFYTKSFNMGIVDLKNYESDAFNAAGVGCMFLCIINFGLIIFIGLGAAKAAEPVAQGFSMASTAAPPTGMGPSSLQMGQTGGMGGMDNKGYSQPGPATF